MIVYGEPTRTVDAVAELDRLEALWGGELDRRRDVFIALSELLAAVGDQQPEAEPAFVALTTAAAAALRGDGAPVPAALFDAARRAAPGRLTVKAAEGYAFYALYPEQYAAAAQALPRGACVIGIRSIGAGLACLVVEAAGAAAPLIVRPTGHPFHREVALPPVPPAPVYAIVDEGPGLSGSSFGAVADALEAQGVAPERIVFLPGHDGDLGAQASPAHRARWVAAKRLHVSFEALIAPQLAGWVADLTGPAERVEDVGGGAWRRLTHGAEEAAWPPSAAHQERRKVLLHTEGGPVLLNFVGLGEHGRCALEQARALHAAGFAPEPLGLRGGFLLQRWVAARPLSAADRPRLLARLGEYFRWRAAALPAPADAGASPEALAEMARVNVTEGLGAGWVARLPAPPPTEPRVFTDNRLHAWEWLVAQDGPLLKADGVDHARAHDLIGAQPVAWDVAGAAVEHGLTADETAALGGTTPFHLTAYAAFQLGLWTQASEALAGWPAEAARCAAQAERYAQALRRMLNNDPETFGP